MNWKLAKIATGISLWGLSVFASLAVWGYLVCEVSPWFVPLILVPMFIAIVYFTQGGTIHAHEFQKVGKSRA